MTGRANGDRIVWAGRGVRTANFKRRGHHRRRAMRHLASTRNQSSRSGSELHQMHDTPYNAIISMIRRLLKRKVQTKAGMPVGAMIARNLNL